MNSSNDRIEIHSNKTHLVLFLIGFSLFLFAIVWSILDLNDYNINLLLLYKLLSQSVLIIAFVLGIISILYYIFDTSNGIVLTNEGIEFDLKSKNVILWLDVKEIKLIKKSGTKVILIITEPSVMKIFINRQNWINRYWLGWSLNYYGSPFVLTNIGYKISYMKLEELVIKKFQEYLKTPKT